MMNYDELKEEYTKAIDNMEVAVDAATSTNVSNSINEIDAISKKIKDKISYHINNTQFIDNTKSYEDKKTIQDKIESSKKRAENLKQIFFNQYIFIIVKIIVYILLFVFIYFKFFKTQKNTLTT